MIRAAFLSIALVAAAPALSADIIGRASVVDGDTIDIHGTRFRIELAVEPVLLAGVDVGTILLYRVASLFLPSGHGGRESDAALTSRTPPHPAAGPRATPPA